MLSGYAPQVQHSDNLLWNDRVAFQHRLRHIKTETIDWEADVSQGQHEPLQGGLLKAGEQWWGGLILMYISSF